MRPIELAPVKRCLPVLRSPGTDHGDMAHTHTKAQAQKHMQYKQRKVLTPSSNFGLQTITGLTAAKPKVKKRGHRVGCLVGWMVNSASKLFLYFPTWLWEQNVFYDEFHSVCRDMYGVITQKRQKHPFIKWMSATVKHGFNSIIFKNTPDS